MRLIYFGSVDLFILPFAPYTRGSQLYATWLDECRPCLRAGSPGHSRITKYTTYHPRGLHPHSDIFVVSFNAALKCIVNKVATKQLTLSQSFR